MNLQSIIVKGDDQRVQPMNVVDLLGKPKNNRRATDKEGETTEACETRIEVLRHEQQVRGIEVHCSCGEVTVIELNYPSVTPPNHPAS